MNTDFKKVKTIDVYMTTDYGMFQKLEGNRAAKTKSSQNHIKRLKMSMEQNPELAPYLPIMVQRGTNKILDGQHRAIACEELGLPIYFTYADDLGIHEAHIINSNTKPWTIEDYAKSYAKLGKEHYVALVDLMKKHDITVAIATVLTSGSVYNGGEKLRAFKVGNYHPVFTPEQTAVLAEELDELAEYVPSIKINSRVAAAWFSIQKGDLYDHNTMVTKIRSKLAVNPDSIKFTTGISDNMRLWEQLYNFKTQTYRRLY